MTNNFPHITVVVPTRNRLHRLPACIDSILSNEYPSADREVVIVDDESTDGTRDYLTAISLQNHNVRVINNELQQGPAASRNRGVETSSGEIVAFTDDDCVVAYDWLHRIAYAFESSRDQVLGGRVYAAGNHIISMYLGYLRLLEPPLLANGDLVYVVTANACFRRSALVDIGGFDETFISPGGEDSELSIRLRQKGIKLRYDASRRVYHWYERSLESFLRRYYAYGVGNRHAFDKLISLERWEPDSLEQLSALLSGSTYLRSFKEVRNPIIRSRFCVLHAFHTAVYLAGYLGIKSERDFHDLIELYDNTSDCSGRISREFSSRIPSSTITNDIFTSIAIDCDKVGNSDVHESLREETALNGYLSHVLKDDDIRSWLHQMLRYLDLDVLLSKVGYSQTIHIPSCPEILLQPDVRRDWKIQIDSQEQSTASQRNEVLSSLLAKRDDYSLLDIEKICFECNLDVNIFLKWYGDILDGRCEPSCLLEPIAKMRLHQGLKELNFLPDI